MDDFTHVTVFDKPYSAEKMAEGHAVHLAVFTGACNRCIHLKKCESDNGFVPPADTWCMKKKSEILKGTKR